MRHPFRSVKQALKIFAMTAVFFASDVFAEDAQRIYRSSHYLGRGDTGLAVADDYEAIFYNPAGLAQGQGIFSRAVFLSPSFEFSDDARNMVTELQDENADTAAILRKRVGKNQHLGLYNATALVFRRAALSIFNGQTTDILVYKSPEAGGLEAVKARLVTSNGIAFALAQDFLNKSLFVGANVKYLHRGDVKFDANVTDADSIGNMDSSDMLKAGMGTSVDLGVIYKLPGLLQPSVAATISNVGAAPFRKMSDEADAPDGLKQVINLGVAIQPQSKMSKFKLMAELWDVSSQINKSTIKKLHLGGDLSVLDTIGFTAGLSEGWSSGGMYVDLRFFRFDAGVYIQEMAERAGVRPDRRLFFRLTLGL
jgi:hypothetical protein